MRARETHYADAYPCGPYSQAIELEREVYLSRMAVAPEIIETGIHRGSWIARDPRTNHSRTHIIDTAVVATAHLVYCSLDVYGGLTEGPVLPTASVLKPVATKSAS